MAYSNSAITRAINRFEQAAEGKAFQGSIPVMSDDPEEQRLLDAHHAAIDRNYRRARKRLEDMLSGS